MNIREHFPILNTKVNGYPLIYFDNAATTQKPQQVINSIVNFYSKNYATIHRGLYSFAEYATSLYEQSRKNVAEFINADVDEIVFTHGATEGINVVALSWAQENIKKGDEIIISQLEHHSNLIPWQQLAKKQGAVLRIIPIDENYELDLSEYENLLTENTKLVAISHLSNVFGTINNIEFICEKAKKFNAKVLIDAAQSIAHQKIDVKKINCDFLVFSGHKMLGPTGIGILYIKKSIHEQIQPYFYGGGMIYEADFEKVAFKKLPYLLEVGTPAIEQVIGLNSAINFINKNINFEELKKYEAKLCSHLINGLSKLSEIKILGPIEKLKNSGHIVSFIIDKIHPHDAAAFFDKFGICVRAGHHCSQPLHKSLKLDSTIRVSFFAYNTLEEVNFFIEIVQKLLES